MDKKRRRGRDFRRRLLQAREVRNGRRQHDDGEERRLVAAGERPVRFHGAGSLQVAGSLARPIGLSPAGRFACGHLNIFTHHPAIGSYSALTPCRVASVPQDAFRSKLARDPALLRLFAAQCELFTLSDRLGLGTVTLLQVRERVCAFLIAWARSFGRLARTSPSDPGWFVVPAPPAGCVCRIVHSTPEYVADVTEEWRKRGLAASNGAEWAVHTPVLRETFEWLTRARGPAELPLPGLFEETAASILEAEAPAWIPRSV